MCFLSTQDLEWKACQTYLLRIASLPVGPSSTAHTLSHSLTSTAFSHCRVPPSSLNPDKYFICKHKAIQTTPTWRSWIFFVMLGPNSFHQREDGQWVFRGQALKTIVPFNANPWRFSSSRQQTNHPDRQLIVHFDRCSLAGSAAANYLFKHSFIFYIFAFACARPREDSL